MSMLAFLIYLAHVAGTAHILAVAGLVITGFFFGVRILATVDAGPRQSLERTYKFVNKYVIVAIVFASLIALFPTRNTVLMMAAAEYGVRIASSENVAKIVDPTFSIVQEYLKKELEKITNDKSGQ